MRDFNLSQFCVKVGTRPMTETTLSTPTMKWTADIGIVTSVLVETRQVIVEFTAFILQDTQFIILDFFFNSKFKYL